MLADSQERRQAINPEQSFIVQAPAGSGKTELLTQRFLGLLARVEAPEQIVALTFTRKAANEMRERIVKALQAAQAGVEPQSPHQTTTLDLAKQALQRDRHYTWNILNQPGRLQIMTIDSLCQLLSHSIPILDRHLAFGEIEDNTDPIYTQAAQDCLEFALNNPDYEQAMEALLLHLDNRQDRLLELFTALLANRAPWLHAIYSTKNLDRQEFEQALAQIEHHEIAQLRQSISQPLSQALCQLSRETTTLINDPQRSHYVLKDWIDFKDAKSSELKALGDLLLTKDDKLRQSFDHNVGLKKDSCSPEDYTRIKTASQSLLQELDAYPEFAERLAKIRVFPPPFYRDEQWAILQTLFDLLPLLAAHLQLVFQKKNRVDFTAVAQQALDALGDEDHPTDLALYLDNAIHHLLIDEFQDTSMGQLKLLEKITQGWLPQDQKTLFIVGDPMQSIYRFRQAEVGLFLKIQQQGLGAIALSPLFLKCNFRSSGTLVNWVNEHFPSIFSKRPEIESGAVDFHPAQAIHPSACEPAVHAYELGDKAQEAAELIAIVKQEQSRDPKQSIAVLVSSRGQLKQVMDALRREAIPYQGVDITLLANLPVIQDVWTLTQALLMPANRLSWLALLRSPYGGIPLQDLLILANANKKQAIFRQLSNEEILAKLSADSRERILRLHQILNLALQQRFSQKLSSWIRSTHEKLAQNCLLTLQQEEDLEQFWQLLEKHEKQANLLDLQQFEQQLKKLYSKQVTPSTLQIMTIHKSKGLEFDCVILPGLSSSNNQIDSSLLRFMKIPSQDPEEIILISPIKSAQEETCPLYNYLGNIDREKDNYETQRLLYVAVTRAKKTLYLLDYKGRKSKKSFRGLLQPIEFTLKHEETESQEEAPTLPEVLTLPLHVLEHSAAASALNGQMLLQAQSDLPRIIGIITHKILQWLGEYHPDLTQGLPQAMIAQELTLAGITGEEHQQATEQIQSYLQRFLASEQGAWIIKQHEQESCELPILLEKNGRISTQIIDRTFVDQGKRWIIDFKTGQHSPDTLATHKEQVNQYAKALTHLYPEPLQCGLYYLESGDWESWG